MKPGQPSFLPTTAFRGASAFLLALLVAAVVDAQPTVEAACRPKASRTYWTVPINAQPPKKEGDKKEPDKKDEKKDEKKEPTKPPEYKWPTDINGKDIDAVMKDMEHPDPTIREFAARTLSGFGPPAQKGNVSKLLLKRMTAERDPGVKIAVFNAVGLISFDAEADNKEAIRLLTLVIDNPNNAGGHLRLHAIQTIAMFGPKGASAITNLTGIAIADPSYETRRNIANALGSIGFNETTGPNMQALTKLADILARDESAAVRMEALQALMLLGPPWEGVKKPDAKMPPPINAKSSAVIIQFMKLRVGDPKKKLVGLEKDKQVEIWARLVLMRFDPAEINEDNLDAFARYLTTPEVGVKVQALQAIALMGELAGKKVDAVAQLLTQKGQPMQLTLVAVQTLAAMGAGAKPAIPELKKLAAELRKTIDTLKDEERKMAVEMIKLKDQERKNAENALKGKESDRKTGEEVVKLIESVIKHIDEAKPVSPAVVPEPKEPKKP